MASILIADDHSVVREGVKQILADRLRGVVIGEAASGSETLAAVRRRHWDLLLLDLNMPGRDGLDVLAELQSLRPRLPVLVFSMHAEIDFVLRALRLGAAGYITKDCIPEELGGAVEKILAGGRYIDSGLAEQLAFDIAKTETGQPHESLSHRELQVLRILGTGRSLKQVAAALNLSPKTISTYRTRILTKIGVATTGELIAYAIRNGLV